MARDKSGTMERSAYQREYTARMQAWIEVTMASHAQFPSMEAASDDDIETREILCG